MPHQYLAWFDEAHREESWRLQGVRICNAGNCHCSTLTFLMVSLVEPCITLLPRPLSESLTHGIKDCCPAFVMAIARFFIAEFHMPQGNIRLALTRFYKINRDHAVIE